MNIKGTLATLVLKLRYWLAAKALLNTGMVIVQADDWRMIRVISATLHKYVHTSGHINNGRYVARKKLHTLVDGLINSQQRFVHPDTSSTQMVPPPEVTKEDVAAVVGDLRSVIGGAE